MLNINCSLRIEMQFTVKFKMGLGGREVQVYKLKNQN